MVGEDIAEGSGGQKSPSRVQGRSPPAGSRGRALVGGLGEKAEASLSTLKYSMHFGEIT